MNVLFFYSPTCKAWLLFLYAGLAMLENILRAKGSNIRPWWLYHHYCAMALALVSLTWESKGQPNCVQKQRGVHLFLQWAMMQEVSPCFYKTDINAKDYTLALH
ncbi:unnamed protein product [Arabidopsis thaliana]|uniref:(thale cress) hypothetical protein n=1 Tax=Arabidopsis thaliana TaxID=3702 RepID=A0A7G2EYJ3_ARATH|nr:unnamed protein product [Arabidopsis thaliana]